MGPDEYPTREELGLVVKFLVAKLGEQGAILAKLAELLESKGIIADSELVSLVQQVRQSRAAIDVLRAESNLQEFLTIRNIAKRYLDPPPEDL